MSRLVILLFFVLKVVSGVSQSELSSIPVEINSNKSSETLTIFDNDGFIHLFIISTNGILILKYDPDNNFIGQSKYPSVPSKFERIRGYSVGKGNRINIYFVDSSNKKYLLFSVLQDGESKTFEFDFKIEREGYIEGINKGNNFHVFTYSKKGSLIKRYTFRDENLEVQEFDLNNESFYNNQNQTSSLAKLFRKKRFEIFNDGVPSSIEMASNKFKLFPKDDSLIITLFMNKCNSNYNP